VFSRVLADYGGPFEDALPVEDPETQLAADQYNRLAEDTAQLTRSGTRAILRFGTTTGAPPNVTSACSVWGNRNQSNRRQRVPRELRIDEKTLAGRDRRRRIFRHGSIGLAARLGEDNPEASRLANRQPSA